MEDVNLCWDWTRFALPANNTKGTGEGSVLRSISVWHVGRKHDADCNANFNMDLVTIQTKTWMKTLITLEITEKAMKLSYSYDRTQKG